MAESSAPTVVGSRSVADNEYEVLSSGFGADGVLGQWTGSTPVFGDSSGRQVKIRANFFALVGGHYYSSGTSDTIKSIAANASGSTRYDLVVLGLNRSTLAVTSYVKQGTPGAGAPPALQRDARGLTTGIWEIPLAQVVVINGASTIAVGDVTNVAWYSRGGVVSSPSGAVTSTLIQPDAASYPLWENSDTGTTMESVSGAWRRWPWQSPWGVIGGKRYLANGNLMTAIFAEAAVGIDSGPVNIEANRRYRVDLRIRISSHVASGFFTCRVRETNISGTVVMEAGQVVGPSAAHCWFNFTGEFTASATATKTYVTTLAFAVNGVNNAVATGSASQAVGLWIEDVGPSVPNSVTVVP